MIETSNKKNLAIWAVLLIPVTLVINGFFVQVLWNVLVVPIFNRAPLPLAYAIGVGLLIAFVKSSTARDEPATVEGLIGAISKGVITSILYVICAVVIAMFF